MMFLGDFLYPNRLQRYSWVSGIDPAGIQTIDLLVSSQSTYHLNYLLISNQRFS